MKHLISKEDRERLERMNGTDKRIMNAHFTEVPTEKEFATLVMEGCKRSGLVVSAKEAAGIYMETYRQHPKLGAGEIKLAFILLSGQQLGDIKHYSNFTESFFYKVIAAYKERKKSAYKAFHTINFDSEGMTAEEKARIDRSFFNNTICGLCDSIAEGRAYADINLLTWNPVYREFLRQGLITEEEPTAEDHRNSKAISDKVSKQQQQSFMLLSAENERSKRVVLTALSVMLAKGQHPKQFWNF